MAISVLGVMVAVPAKGAIPSTKYIQEAINNMSTPAGSVITGYGSVDGVQPYLLAGTGTGSAGWLSYSDLVSGLSGYLKGSVITGYTDANSGSYILVGSGGTGSAGWMPGSHIASGLGSYIRGYETVTADVSHVLVGSGDDGTAGWMSYENLASGLGGYLKGSQISGYGMGTGSEVVYLLAGSNATGSPFFVSVSNLGSRIGGYGYYNGNGSMILVGSGYGEAKWMSTYGLAPGLGNYIGSYLTYVPGSKVMDYGNMSAQSSGGYLLVGTGTGSAGWLSYSLFGADIGGYMTGIKGSAIWWDTTTGSAAFILAGSETGKWSKASWLSYEDLASGLSPYLGGGGGASVPAGSVITGYGSTNQASHVLVGSGGSSTANWISYGNLASGLGVHLGSKVMGYGWRSSASHILAGTGDGSAAWMSYEDLASGLSSYLGGGAPVPAGSVITGYGSVDGLQPYLLAGTGTGSAGWMLWSTLLTGMGGPISYVLSGSVIRFTGSTSTGAYVFAGGSYAGTGAWLSYSNLAAGLGSYLGSYILGSFVSGINGSNVSWHGSWSSASHVLAGTGSGIAAWMSYSNLAAGLGSHIGSYIPGSYLSGIRGSVVTGYGSMSYASHVLVGSGGSSAAYWMSYSGLASGLGSQIGSYLTYVPGFKVVDYGNAIAGASRVLAGTGMGSAGWLSYEDLVTQLEPYMGDLQAESLGSYISGFNTGSMGSWLLMGQGINPGVPNYVRLGDLYNNFSSGIMSHVFRSGSWLGGYTNITYASYVLAGSHAESHSAANWLSYEDLATGLSPYIVGSQITAYGSAETGSYILAGTGAGSAGWVEMSGLGTKIEFQETATAEELQANTGTIYFPVIQNGKIYGVTANDFYILMNAGQ